MIQSTQLSPGMVIKFNNELFSIFKTEHLTPGNLRGFVQANMRNLRSGAMIEHRFSSEDRVERATLEEHEMEYLYDDGEFYYFMNTENYEQVSIPHDVLGESVDYLTPNLKIRVEFYEGRPIGVELPDGDVVKELTPSPMNEEPLKLIPRDWRERIFPDLCPRDSGFTIPELGELNPSCRFIFRQLMAKYEGDFKKVIKQVRVRRLFPWSEGEPYVSLRDGKNREVAALGPDADLDPASAHVLAEATRAASFVLEITRVLAVEDEIEIRRWTVETLQGPRAFQTRLDDWPTEVPGGRFLIRDVAGDLYLVSDPASLDRRSREILWAFVG